MMVWETYSLLVVGAILLVSLVIFGWSVVKFTKEKDKTKWRNK